MARGAGPSPEAVLARRAVDIAPAHPGFPGWRIRGRGGVLEGFGPVNEAVVDGEGVGPGRRHGGRARLAAGVGTEVNRIVLLEPEDAERIGLKRELLRGRVHQHRLIYE